MRKTREVRTEDSHRHRPETSGLKAARGQRPGPGAPPSHWLSGVGVQQEAGWTEMTTQPWTEEPSSLPPVLNDLMEVSVYLHKVYEAGAINITFDRQGNRESASWGGTGTGAQATWPHTHMPDTPPPPPGAGCTRSSLQRVQGGRTAGARALTQAHVRTHTHRPLRLKTSFWVKETRRAGGRRENFMSPQAAPEPPGGFSLHFLSLSSWAIHWSPGLFPHPKSGHLVYPEAAGGYPYVTLPWTGH